MFWKLGKNLLRMKISVVVPVYNSQSSLEELVTRLQSVLPTCSSKFEIILVNDGSTDKSADVIRKLEQLYDFVVPINLMRNYGQHSALLCGIRAARYEVTVTLDDDLQNPPEEIPKLLALLEEGYDVVYGTREKEQHGIFRNLASRITKLTLARTMGVGIADNISSFRAFRTSIRNSFEQYRSSLVMLDVLLTWGATKFAYVKVSHFARLLGQSNYGLRNLFVHALNMITGFTTIPLQLATLYGFACTGFGVIMLACVIVRHFVDGVAPPGFAFLSCVIIIFSGAQLIALGIIGEYLGRIFLNVQGKPPYAVKDLQNLSEAVEHSQSLSFAPSPVGYHTENALIGK